MAKIPRDTDGNVKTVNENSSCTLKFQLIDPTNGNVVLPGNIVSCVLTLTNKSTDEVINDREDEDVRDKFNGTGLFQMVLDPADNVILSDDPAVGEEVHVATVVSVVLSGDDPLTLTEEIWITVTNNQQS